MRYEATCQSLTSFEVLCRDAHRLCRFLTTLFIEAGTAQTRTARKGTSARMTVFRTQSPRKPYQNKQSDLKTSEGLNLGKWRIKRGKECVVKFTDTLPTFLTVTFADTWS